MTLLPETRHDEPDDARRRRLAPTRKLKIKPADHEAGDDDLTALLNGVWSHSAIWARAIRDHQKDAHGVVLSLDHARDLLAASLVLRPMSWVMIIRSRPSRLLVGTLLENLESVDSRIFIQPEPADHLAIWGSEENVRKALMLHGSDACRRRWYANRVATPRELKELHPQRLSADWLPAGVIV